VTLVGNQEFPHAIAIDSKYVYWTALGDPNKVSAGKVAKVLIGGGKEVVLATSQDKPRAIAVDANSVYWVASDGGTVVKVAK